MPVDPNHTNPVLNGECTAQAAELVCTSGVCQANNNECGPPLTLAATASTLTQVGQIYLQSNTASGGLTPYTYSVSAGSLPAGTTLNTTTGVVSGTPTTAGAFSYTIEVTDSSAPTPQTATQTLSGSIIGLTSTASSITQVGQVYYQTNVAAGGTTPYTYSLLSGALPAGPSLNTSTGTVLGTPTTAGAFSYTIEVTDSSSPAVTAAQIVSGTINPPPSLSPSSLPADTIGVALFGETITATGGTGSHTIAVSNVQNALSGVSLPSSGSSITLSGTPTAAGTETFTATVTDSVGATATANYSLTVNAALSLSPSSLPADTINVAYNQTITATGGTGSHTIAISNIQNALPGVSLPSSGSSITLSGTPTAAGTETFTATVTDSVGATATANYSLTVNPALSLSPSPSSTTQVGQPYSQTNVAAGGTTPYTYSLASGSLPAGTTLNTSTGTVSGTPTTAGSFSYAIKVTDSGSPTPQTATTTTISGIIAPPTPVPGQALRAFVAGSGVDSNPCSLALPCRSFQQAFSTLAAGGEIDVLEPAGYGPLTITYAVSIQGHGFSGITASGGANAITINAGASDDITLNGLLIDGAGSGQSGILVNTAGSLQILDCVVRHFNVGINYQNAMSPNNLLVQDTVVSDNASNGIAISPPTGIVANATLRGTAANNNGASGVNVLNANATIASSVLTNNATGLTAQSGSTVLLSKSKISTNATGVLVSGGTVNSYGNNDINGNGSNGSGLTTISPQ